MTDFAWNEERVTFLRELFAAGCHTSSEMAALLAQRYTEALTRSAIIGKLSRIGLKRGRKAAVRIAIPGTPKPPRKPPQRRFHQAAILAALEPKPAPAVISAPSSAHHCDIMGLTNSSCRFPVTDEPPHMFCGVPDADLIGGAPYCLFHTRMSYSGKPDRRAQYRPAGDTWMPLGVAARNVVANIKANVACTIRREESKEVVVREDPSQGENSISDTPREAGSL